MTLPTSITSLAYYAFEGCYHISSVTLTGEGEWRGGTISILRPVTVTIGSKITAVKGMYLKPSQVYCYAVTPPVCDANSFTDYSGTLHVPAESLAAYQSAPYWKNFANIVGDAVEPAENPELGDVNGDGRVTINDVTALVNYLLSLDASGIKLDNADVNNDGRVSIGDATALINILLTSSH